MTQTLTTPCSMCGFVFDEGEKKCQDSLAKESMGLADL